MKRAILLTTCVAMLSSMTYEAEAVMPPSVYRQAAKNARHHVQVKLLKVRPARTMPGECKVTGKIVRIFRDRTKALKKGKRISFTVSCRRKGDSVPVGGTIWKAYEALSKAKYLEAALNSRKGVFSVAKWNTSIIAKPSKKPQYGFPFHQKK